MSRFQKTSKIDSFCCVFTGFSCFGDFKNFKNFKNFKISDSVDLKTSKSLGRLLLWIMLPCMSNIFLKVLVEHHGLAMNQQVHSYKCLVQVHLDTIWLKPCHCDWTKTLRPITSAFEAAVGPLGFLVFLFCFLVACRSGKSSLCLLEPQHKRVSFRKVRSYMSLHGPGVHYFLLQVLWLQTTIPQKL